MFSRCIALLFLALTAVSPLSAQVSVVTYHNDISRTGQNLSETLLTPTNVNAANFGRLFSVPVDGAIYAQPLYMPNVTVGGASHRVIYVATEHDSVYAFDANAAGAPLWHVNLIPPGASTMNSSTDINCGDLVPEIGITGTPAIDSASGTLYAVTVTNENGSIVQRLHALNITSGAEKFGGPVVIQASAAGTGPGSSGGVLPFDPRLEHNRAALLLQNGLVYIAWGSHCDISPWHGWVMAYSATTLAQQAVFTTSPDVDGDGVWGGGMALAGDGTNLYFGTGNGKFDVGSGGPDYGDSIVKLGPPSGGTFPVLSWFSPYNQSSLDINDTDLGSGGILLLPTPSGATHQLLVHAGKDGIIHILDRQSLGGYCSGCASDTNIFQEIPGAIHGIWGGPAYWSRGSNGYLYFGATNDNVKAFSFNASGNEAVAGPTSISSVSIGRYGPIPSISANGANGGIVWIIQADAYQTGGAAILRAFDALDVSHELYNSTQNANDSPGGAVKFTVPTVADGKVYVPSKSQLSVYGLLQVTAQPTFSPVPGTYSKRVAVTLADASPGAVIYFTTNGSTPTTSSKIYKSPVVLKRTTTIRAMAVVPKYQSSSVATATYTIR